LEKQIEKEVERENANSNLLDDYYNTLNTKSKKSSNIDSIKILLSLIKDIDKQNILTFKFIKNKLLLPLQNVHILSNFLKIILREYLQPIFSPALLNSFRHVYDIYSPVDALKLLVLPSPLSTPNVFNRVFLVI
jgi:hypothetical protein